MNVAATAPSVIVSDAHVRFRILLPDAATDYIQGKLLAEETPYELEMLADMRGRLRRGDLLVDVGANIGNHTLYMASAGASVVAFEPNPTLAAALAESVRLNGFEARVTVAAQGVGAEPGAARLEQADAGNLGAARLTVGEGDVLVATLDAQAFPAPVRLLKIDVEGMELAVLDGAEALIARDRPLIYVECARVTDFDAVAARLERHGYLAWRMFNATPTHLFVPAETVDETRRAAHLHGEAARAAYARLQVAKTTAARLRETETELQRSTAEAARLREAEAAAQGEAARLREAEAAAQGEAARLREAAALAQAEAARREAALAEAADEARALRRAAQELRAARDRQISALRRRQLVRVDGAAVSDAAMVALLNRLCAAPAWRRLRLTPRRIADLCRDVARTEMGDAVDASVVLSSLACALDPQPWREKWRAFALDRLGLRQAASRRIAALKDAVTFSASEARRRDDLLRDQAEEGAPTAAPPPRPRRTLAPNATPRVACVMDPFTRRAFDPEWTLQDLSPDGWAGEIAAFDPDFVFVESAWEGAGAAWRTRISGDAKALTALARHCRAHAIPLVFWNKEDPVHFANFIAAAKLADIVFTTDIDCIPRYRHALGHDRIYLLPFGLQPRYDNPLATIERQNGFCFAGSYYLRYPERQRDFDRTIEAVRPFGEVTIFDRNQERDHPHYRFPDKFHPYIRGSLPVDQIHRAYKGYRYGLNMSTIKQSQTMFARRVFELIGSNTIVIGNFARGLRYLFGDLVISTDSAHDLQARLKALDADRGRARKLRLMALRKVLQQHTYAERAALVTEKALGVRATGRRAPSAVVVAQARDADEAAALVAAFRRQRHAPKSLLLLAPDAAAEAAARTAAQALPEGSDAVVFAEPTACAAAARAALTPGAWLAVFDPRDWYGPHYLTDLLLAPAYTSCAVLTKAPPDPEGEDAEYRPAAAPLARASVLRADIVDDALLTALIETPDAATPPADDAMALDGQHHLTDGAALSEDVAAARAGDPADIDVGLSMTDDVAAMVDAARATRQWSAPSADDVPRLTTDDLGALFAGAGRRNLTLRLEEDALAVTATLPAGKHAYVYADAARPREALNLRDNSLVQMRVADGATLDLRMVYEFQDAEGRKLAHNMHRVGGEQALTIPAACTQVRLGLRAEGAGVARIGPLMLGGAQQRPALIFARSRTLALTKQYPSHGDLYRYGFLHSRLRGYHKAGRRVDVFRLSPDGATTFGEFEGVDVASGDAAQLETLLDSGRVDHVLVHLLDAAMWAALRPRLDRLKVTVWIHGAEIQHWRRRAYEFDAMSEAEIDSRKRHCDARMAFWREIFADPHPNLRLVFVSRTLAREAAEDVGLAPPEGAWTVAHNPIDVDLFAGPPKTAEHRKRILLIRSFSSRTYANDLAAAAIERLSTAPFFPELQFRLVGDGALFDAVTAPLRRFDNVRIDRGFLTHAEIAALQRDHGVFLIPTRMDSQGVSRDEAMAAGLVPVTNAVAAVREFVDDSCAMLAPPEDADALAEGVATLYRDPERFLRMSAAAAARVRRQSAADAIIAQELAVIDRRAAP